MNRLDPQGSGRLPLGKLKAGLQCLGLPVGKIQRASWLDLTARWAPVRLSTSLSLPIDGRTRTASDGKTIRFPTYLRVPRFNNSLQDDRRSRQANHSYIEPLSFSVKRSASPRRQRGTWILSVLVALGSKNQCVCLIVIGQARAHPPDAFCPET